VMRGTRAAALFGCRFSTHALQYTRCSDRLLLCATRRTPTEIAVFLFCARSSIYRIIRAYQAGTLGFLRNAQGQLVCPPPPSGLHLSL
jgi:hypothetical protein